MQWKLGFKVDSPKVSLELGILEILTPILMVEQT